jgi:FkbM family methyltransferase
MTWTIRKLALSQDRLINADFIRSRTFVTSISDTVAVCRILGSYALFILKSDRAHAVRLMIDGFWELSITEFIVRKLQPGSCFIDIGANYGYHTVLACALLRTSGSVVSYEPNPAVYSLLTDTVRVNGFKSICQTHQLAVSGEAADVAFAGVNEMSPMKGGVKRIGQPDHHEQIWRTISFTRAITDLPKVDLVKIDIEGEEEYLIPFIPTLFEKHPDATVILEFDLRRYTDRHVINKFIFADSHHVAILSHNGELSSIAQDSIPERQITLVLSRAW